MEFLDLIAKVERNFASWNWGKKLEIRENEIEVLRGILSGEISN